MLIMEYVCTGVGRLKMTVGVRRSPKTTFGKLFEDNTRDPKARGPQPKNAPQDCEAFGAENEIRTFVCNTNIIKHLRKLMMKPGVK